MKTEKNLYKASSPVPEMPENADKNIVRNIIKEYAHKHKFGIASYKSEEKRIIYRCRKGGIYRNTGKLKLEERKNRSSSVKMECPYLVRFSSKKNQGFKVLPPKDENETYHNHPLTEEDYQSIHEGRRFKSLSDQDINDIKYEVENKVPKLLLDIDAIYRKCEGNSEATARTTAILENALKEIKDAVTESDETLIRSPQGDEIKFPGRKP